MTASYMNISPTYISADELTPTHKSRITIPAIGYVYFFEQKASFHERAISITYMHIFEHTHIHSVSREVDLMNIPGISNDENINKH